MKPPSRFKVGLIFLLGLAFSIGVLIWIGAANFFGHSKAYVAYFDSSVKGIDPGAQVSYRGIQVGQVRSKRLAPDKRLVEVDLAMRSSFALRKGQALSIASQGLTGSSYLELAEPPAGTKLTEPPFRFEVHEPVIPTYGGGNQQLFGAVSQIANEIHSLPLDELVTHWSQAGKHLDEAVSNEDIGRTLDNLRNASADAERLLDTLASPDTRKNVREGVADLAASARAIRKASTTLSDQLASLRPNAFGDVSGELGQTVSSLHETIRRLDLILPHVDDLVRTLRQQPGRLTVRHREQEPFDR